MHILSADQHRQLDAATLAADGIDSRQLMERAATAWTEAFVRHYPADHREVVVVAGTGNNGGDGLVIARLLRFRGYTSRAVVVGVGTASEDQQHNRRRARDTGVPVRDWALGEPLPVLTPGCIVIDALFGTGLSRPIEGELGRLIDHLNEQPVTRVAVDLPSGLYADRPPEGHIVRAQRTLSLGYPKLALFAPANTNYLGDWELVPFAVADRYAAEAEVVHHMLREKEVAKLLRLRRANDHKGTFGHALLVAGAFGKMGAAIIAARAVLRAGAGLVTTHLPRCGYEIMQISFPEAMCSVDRHRYQFTGVSGVDRYDVVGIGPGLGTASSSVQGLDRLLEEYDRPMVVDADALNIVARQGWLDRLPRGSVLTPHPKEFERLFGETTDDFARWELQRQQAQQLGLIILCKTGYTSIATPNGALYLNTTGNPGMGTGGTGDALTGVITGLLAQGYTSEDAARLGVYLHGLAGDLAAEELEQESLLAEDVVHHLGRAFRVLHAVRATG